MFSMPCATTRFAPALGLVAGLGVMALSQPASAIVITDPAPAGGPGTPNNIVVGFSAPSPTPGATYSATAVLSNFTFAGNDFSFDVQLTNTTTSPNPATDVVRLSAFGFAVNPDANSLSLDDGALFDEIVFNSIPSLNATEVCVYAANNCSSANGGLEQGESDSFGITLSFLNPVSSVDLTDFGVRIAGDFNSLGVTGTIVPPPPPPTAAPEPGTVFLLASGILGLGLLLRGRRGARIG